MPMPQRTRSNRVAGVPMRGGRVGQVPHCRVQPGVAGRRRSAASNTVPLLVDARRRRAPRSWPDATSRPTTRRSPARSALGGLAAQHRPVVRAGPAAAEAGVDLEVDAGCRRPGRPGPGRAAATTRRRACTPAASAGRDVLVGRPQPGQQRRVDSGRAQRERLRRVRHAELVRPAGQRRPGGRTAPWPYPSALTTAISGVPASGLERPDVVLDGGEVDQTATARSRGHRRWSHSAWAPAWPAASARLAGPAVHEGAEGRGGERVQTGGEQ